MNNLDVLVVSVSEQVASGLMRAGQEMGVQTALGLDEAKRLLAARHFDALVVDVPNDTLGPAQWMQTLAATQPHCSLVAAVTAETRTVAERWLEGGATEFIEAPEFVGVVHRLQRIRSSRVTEASKHEQERSLKEGTARLLKFARSSHFLRGENLEEALARLTEIAVHALQVERASVWRVSEDGEHLILLSGVDTRSGLRLGNATLSLEEHKTYFEAMKTQTILSVSDVRTDPRTHSFNVPLFEPFDVMSTLDVLVGPSGAPAGIMCFEKTGTKVNWSATQEVFAGAVADVLALTFETAERFRAEEALHESERRFREVFQYSNDVIITYRVALDGGVFLEDINPAGERIIGMRRADVVGRNPLELLPSETAQRMRTRFSQSIESRLPMSWEHDLTMVDKQLHFYTSLIPLIDEHGRVYRIAAISRDITSRHHAERVQRQLETQLSETLKSEALARLAAHIAHDFNNLLTVVSAHASRLHSQSPLAQEVGERIIQATDKGRELTQQILAFGRKKAPTVRLFDLSAEVRSTLQLLAVTAPSIEFRHEIHDNVMVSADAAQLGQVLSNLVSNALEAMGERGALHVSLAEVEVDERLAMQTPPLTAGHWVRLQVQDSGVGMDHVTKRRIFEPYFTNRRTGSGTGLGLTLVKSIVLGLGGAISVASELGQGTTFSVYIPKARQTESGVVRPGEGKHLILVDDHVSVGKMSAQLLETLGYRLSVFDDPREALTVFLGDPERFDAVLTDLTMPQMSAAEFARSLLSVRPHLPVVVTSAEPTAVVDEHIKSLGMVAVLPKPWSLEDAQALLSRLMELHRSQLS